MSPDRIELRTTTRRVFLGMLAGFVGGVSLGCAPKVPEPLARGATSTSPSIPPELPTSTPEPTNTPEPSATPEPTRVPVVEIPYQMYGIYSTSLFADQNPQPKGGIVIVPLPSPINRILVHYDIYRTYNGKPERFSGNALVDFKAVRGPGFQAADLVNTSVVTAALIKPGVMAGNIQFKENVPPGAAGERFSFSNADFKGIGREVLGQELVSSFKKIGGGENPPEKMIQMVEEKIKATIPQESK